MQVKHILNGKQAFLDSFLQWSGLVESYLFTPTTLLDNTSKQQKANAEMAANSFAW